MRGRVDATNEAPSAAAVDRASRLGRPAVRGVTARVGILDLMGQLQPLGGVRQSTAGAMMETSSIERMGVRPCPRSKPLEKPQLQRIHLDRPLLLRARLIPWR
jgi:hypothetical protein